VLAEHLQHVGQERDAGAEQDQSQDVEARGPGGATGMNTATLRV